MFKNGERTEEMLAYSRNSEGMGDTCSRQIFLTLNAGDTIELRTTTCVTVHRLLTCFHNYNVAENMDI